MVGLARITARYVGRPDMGCLDLCVAVLRECGYAMPDAVDGLGIDNYRPLAKRSMRAAESALLARMWRVGAPADAARPLRCDFIAVLQPKSGGVFPAVAMGGGRALASFVRHGVQLFRLDDLNRCILARRLPLRRRGASA